MKKIWITRDEDEATLYAWTSKPTDCGDNYQGGNDSCEIECGEGQRFIKKLLGNEWTDEGMFCVEIELGAVKKDMTPSQLVADKLRKMTKTNFRKATINEAVKLLDE